MGRTALLACPEGGTNLSAMAGLDRSSFNTEPGLRSISFNTEPGFGKAGMDAGGEEMDETDPLVKDTGGQEVQRKVLFPGL